MIGQYVHMVVAPRTRIGTVEAACFDRGRIRFLFHQDSRLEYKLPDVWLEESEVEECQRPSDEQVAEINDMTIADY